jgi:hypothetical protein
MQHLRVSHQLKLLGVAVAVAGWCRVDNMISESGLKFGSWRARFIKIEVSSLDPGGHNLSK